VEDRFQEGEALLPEEHSDRLAVSAKKPGGQANPRGGFNQKNI